MTIIYKITSPTNKIYIGQSRNWYSRKSKYKKLRCGTQVKLYRSLKKHGFESHSIEFILEVPDSIDQESLNFYEIYYWQYYKDLGYEMLNIRYPGSNGKMSEETKKKLSSKFSGKNNPMFGKFGKDHPAFGNKCYWENWKQKGLNHPMLGKKGELSPNFGKRVGDKNPSFGKIRGKSSTAKRVINTLTGKIYLCAKDAAEAENLNYGPLCDYLRRFKVKRRKSKNLLYLDDYLNLNG